MEDDQFKNTLARRCQQPYGVYAKRHAKGVTLRQRIGLDRGTRRRHGHQQPSLPRLRSTEDADAG